MPTQTYDTARYTAIRSVQNLCLLQGAPMDLQPVDCPTLRQNIMDPDRPVCTGLGFFLFEELVQTHDPRCWQAAKACWDRFRSSARSSEGLLLPREPGAHVTLPNGLPIQAYYASLPFAMMWETRCNGKENYNEMMDHFTACAQEVEHNFEHCSSAALGYYLMMLADSIEHVSVEVYEKHRLLIDLLRRGFQLAARRPVPQFEGDGTALTAAALYKACRCGWVHAENHRPTADALMRAAMETTPAFYLARSERALCDDAQRRDLA